MANSEYIEKEPPFSIIFEIRLYMYFHCATLPIGHPSVLIVGLIFSAPPVYSAVCDGGITLQTFAGGIGANWPIVQFSHSLNINYSTSIRNHNP